MPKLLIVDDDADIVESEKKYFELQEWVAVGVLSGEQALKVLDTSFDAVVLDLEMRPGMHGEDVLSVIRSRQELNGVCVVILTAYGKVESAVSCLRKGAFQYLQKPFKYDDLKSVVISGIAIQKAHDLPKTLLITPDPKSALKAIYSIIHETINPPGLLLSFLKTDGAVEWTEPGNFGPLAADKREFVTQILGTRRPIYESDPLKVMALQPVNPNSKSLLVAPVPTVGAGITGILCIESTEKDAFDRSWVDVLAYLSNLLAMALELWAKQREALEAVEKERQRWSDLPIVVKELRHHISTPAQVISMQARELIEKDLNQASSSGTSGNTLQRIAERVKAIQKNADAIKRVCSSLSNVAEEVRADKRPFNLLTEIEDCVAEVKAELDAKNIRLTINDASRDFLQLNADKDLIRYCFQCLLRNSIEAIEEWRNHPTAPRSTDNGDEIAIEVKDLIPGRIQINFKDTGIGVAPENKDRIFQPLFSTKQKQDPGGLGLFGVRRIMNQHEGMIDFDREMNRGATFTLYFPRT